MWHLRASPKKQHFILIHSEFKKTVVAVRSIGAAGFLCEEADEGKEFRGQETEIVELEMTGREKSFFYMFAVISFLKEYCTKTTLSVYVYTIFRLFSLSFCCQTAFSERKQVLSLVKSLSSCH